MPGEEEYLPGFFLKKFIIIIIFFLILNVSK